MKYLMLIYGNQDISACRRDLPGRDEARLPVRYLWIPFF
jgi:hypothetical protein